MAVMPTAAQGVVVPGDKNGDKIVSKDELASVILPYMLGAGHLGLDEVREIAHIHVYYPKTIVDSAGRTVTIYRPVERIVTLSEYSAEVI
jgi:iron complex transport system substrate-binding protein